MLALGGLAWYAVETMWIRKATLSQSEASRRPFFTFALTRMTDGSIFGLKMKNVGTGHALHVLVSSSSLPNEQVPQNGDTIAVGEDYLLFQAALSPATILAGHLEAVGTVVRSGVKIMYEDIAGKKYWSTYTRVQEQPEVFATDTGEVRGPSLLAKLKDWSKREQEM